MRYQIIDLGDEFNYGDEGERFGVIDTEHTIKGHEEKMSKIVSRYHPLSHVKILCEGLNSGSYGQQVG